MATLHKFKLLATQCAVAGSPTRSPTTSPVVHLRRRKTLRMLLNRTSDRRRFSRRENSPDLQEIADESPEVETNGSNKKKEIRARSKLKELFVSSPPFEDRDKSGGDDREGLLPATTSVNSGGGGGGGSSAARRVGSSSSLRPVSATFRYRLLRRAWRPMLVTIPE